MENEKLVRVYEGNYEKGKTVTDSYIVATNAGITHKSLKETIRKYQNDLKEFGELPFKTAVENSNNPETFYELNELQATLLFTFLKNTDQVRKFKKTLVKAFFTLRDEIVKRNETRSVAKIDRKLLTETIIESGEQERMHGHGISTYTNLIYISIFGKNAKAIYEERKIPKLTKNLKDFMTEDELKKIDEKEILVKQLLELKYEYQQIKNILKVK